MDYKIIVIDDKNYKIRTASESDLKQIEDLHRAIYIPDSINDRIATIKKVIDDDKKRDDKWAYVCDLDSNIIGVGVISDSIFFNPKKIKDNSFSERDFKYQHSVVQLTRMLIDKNHQKLRIGTKLSEILHQIALKVNTPVIYRLQTTQNTGTQKIALEMGYKPTGILLAVTMNYYNESENNLPFHSVIQFMKKENVENDFVIQRMYVSESTKPFVELVSGINGMQNTSIKISDKKYENINLDIFEWEKGLGSYCSIVDLGYKDTTSKLEQLTEKGFVPTTILPFYKVQFDKDGKGRYHHALAMQKFNINPRLDLLKIDENNENLVKIRDYIVSSIK
jgi:hypothetical protein